jgi:hypothetical protein
VSKSSNKAKPSVLWESNGGVLACPKHLGFAASAELKARPKARTIITSLDHWTRTTKAEAAQYRSEGMGCEGCGEIDYSKAPACDGEPFQLFADDEKRLFPDGVKGASS